uniref:Peptidase A2 domain-containing protein n=2 Tax=gambiae species complex TaxID=44542 RepID=A0A1S4HDH2_ANOGA
MSKPLPVSSVKKLDFRSSEIGEVGGLRISRRLQIFDKSSGIRFLIDTGSDVSIIPASKIEKTREPSPFLLHAANGTKIRTYGNKFVSVVLGLRRKFSWNFSQADVTSTIIGADLRLIDGGTKLHTVCGLSKSSVYGVTTIAKDHPFRDLLVEFREITAPPTMRTEVRHNVTHHIQTTGPPVASKPRRMPPDKLQAAKKEFETMMELGICRPSKSSWASPLHCVPKKNGQWRFVGDYRSLNRITVPDRYPVPHIHDLLNNFLGKNCFTTLDVVRAYLHNKINYSYTSRCTTR